MAGHWHRRLDYRISGALGLHYTGTMSLQPTPQLLPTSPTTRATIPWRQILWFVIGTYALAWLVALPLYIVNDERLFQGLYLPVGLLTMLIPGLVAWLIVRKNHPKGRRAAALGFGRPRPLPRFFGYLALAFVIPVIIGVLSMPIASALGFYDADLKNFSGLQQTLMDAGLAGISLEFFLIAQLVNVVLASWFINLLPALGEEIGWRGWLTPQLLPMGVVPTILITGVIWGLWHTPLILLGHNYPSLPGWLSVIFMVVFCTLIGGILAWLTIRTNSVWPAALGHSTVNATAALPLLFSAEPTYDAAHVGIAGTAGWIIATVILGIFLLTRSFKPAPQPAVDPAAAWPSDYPSAR